MNCTGKLIIDIDNLDMSVNRCHNFSLNHTKLLCNGKLLAHEGHFLRKTRLSITFATIFDPASDFVTDFPRSTHLITGHELALAHTRPVGG